MLNDLSAKKKKKRKKKKKVESFHRIIGTFLSVYIRMSIKVKRSQGDMMVIVVIQLYLYAGLLQRCPMPSRLFVRSLPLNHRIRAECNIVLM